MYHNTAKGIAALGRNGDDTLLHVNKGELEGLQQLLGPVSVNPSTGLPEAFSWTTLLEQFGIGILGALTGGAAAPALGAIGATAVGAGTGALVGGGLSAMQGKGFAPGAFGGAISGGLGGFGGADLPGGATPAGETAGASIPIKPIDAVSAAPRYVDPITGQVSGGAMNSVSSPQNYISQIETSGSPSGWDQYGTNLSQQGSAMITKPGMEYLAKPVGMGALLGTTAEDTMSESNVSAMRLREEKLKKAEADKENRNYMASLGFPLPEGDAGTSWSPDQQRSYFDKIIYGAAAGGPIELSRMYMGTPITTTLPAKYVSKYEDANIPKEIQPLMQATQGMANGGYINLQPEPAQGFYPMSQIASAKPYAAATPQRTEVLQNPVPNSYAKGGFLDGPGDGMSDDIPANIDGREEIRVADGEFIIPPELVRMIGSGDAEQGKHLLDQLLPMVRQAAHGKKQQIKQNAGKLAAEKLLTRKGHAVHTGIGAAGKH